MGRHTVRVAAVVGALLLLAAAACTPESPTPPDPDNIANLTDEQAEAELADALPDVEAALSDPDVLAEIPEEYADHVDSVLTKLRTVEGRAELVDDLRDESLELRGGFLPDRDKFAGGVIDAVVALPEGESADPELDGVRSPAPPKTGASVPYGAVSGTCGAPGGQGPLPAPASLVPNQLITPAHDVFARFEMPLDVIAPVQILVPAGVPPIGGGAGVEFRSTRSGWQMRVQVDLSDENKGFPARALYPLFHLRPLGATAAEEVQLQPVEGGIYCYAGDGEGTGRGYFDGWVPIPPGQPGFQLITEVVENDYHFRFGGELWEPALAGPGPQYFTGGDRSTVHIGEEPLTDAAPLDHAVGAFATTAKDPGDGEPNVLTDTNGVRDDDLEGVMADLLESKVVGALSDELSGTLKNAYVLTLWGSLEGRPTAEVDLRYVDPETSFPGTSGVPPGVAGALEARIQAEASAGIASQFLGVPCFGIELDVAMDVTADVWAESAGVGTGLTPRFESTTDPDVDVSMPWYNWAFTSCIVAYSALEAKASGQVSSGVESALDGALGQDGEITELLQGFDLNDYLPDLRIDPISVGGTTTGGAVMRPVVTNLDNAWCRAPGGPEGCTVDQNLLGANGVEVAADATLVSSLGQALAGPLGGRFPNVFAPSTSSSVDELVTSHRDAAGAFAGLGVVLDPRLVNLGLRALVQGPSTTTTTNGLLDITGLQLPLDGFTVSSRPEVAPLVLGEDPFAPAPTNRSSVRAMLPDVRLDLRTAPQDPSTVRYSAAATVNASAEYDPPTGQLRPVLDSPVIDIQITGGCQVDYDVVYALSYFFCGRGTGGNGGADIASLNDLLDRIANEMVLPLIHDTVGSIGLPSLDGVLPGVHLALDNIRFAQRGGFLTVYGDMRPAPMVRLVGSTAGYGGEDDTVRFFAVPTNIDVVNTATTYSWQIRDGVTGQPVPFTVYPGTGGSAVQFASSAFVAVNTDPPRKTVEGTVTIGQAGLQVTGSGSFSWARATAVPPPNCPPPPGQFLSTLPGGVGGYSPGIKVC